MELDVDIADDFYYHYGSTLYKNDSYNRAIENLTKYIELTGKGSKYYQQALELLVEAEEVDPEAIYKTAINSLESLNGLISNIYQFGVIDKEYEINVKLEVEIKNRNLYWKYEEKNDETKVVIKLDIPIASMQKAEIRDRVWIKVEDLNVINVQYEIYEKRGRSWIKYENGNDYWEHIANIDRWVDHKPLEEEYVMLCYQSDILKSKMQEEELADYVNTIIEYQKNEH